MLEKEGGAYFIVNVPCSYNTWVVKREMMKIDHHQYLKVDVQKIWSCRSVTVILIVIGALGAVSKHLRMWVSELGTPGIIALLQKACFLGTAKILRRSLET